MPNYAMVIDLHKCTGCGACAITCKNENNVQEGFFWSNYVHKTTGEFPNVRFEFMPTLCNHCEDAPCVKACPVGAMYKDKNGITLHDPEKCIGCKSCMIADPYGVIYFNKERPHKFWNSSENAIHNGTSSGKEVADKAGAPIPYYNPEREKTYAGIRPQGIVEKCTFCDHRVKDGEKPYCVESCPAGARIFGDLDDPHSEIIYLISKHGAKQLKAELGTKPKVFYIRSY
ncbi:MAG: 4Fe-4S ferredoxin [Peptococcaceae bacterium BICA1-8]|nr:MAG: 4Fe-4S ferredoxin [Peptococcaceae bacterium BICA1-8]